MSTDPQALVARFWSKVDKAGENGCWLWRGTRRPAGYGTFYKAREVTRKNALAHRMAYELMVGPIPEGLVIDHLCRNPPCVNPSHLEPVTIGENARRGFLGVKRKAERAAVTACPQGHAFSPVNTLIDKHGHRRCRVCDRTRRKIARRRLAAEAASAARAGELEAALQWIERWFGEFPETGEFWPGTERPMSYAACYGSNGERDYMRSIARAALRQTDTKEGDA
jgi:hypothetical protein